MSSPKEPVNQQWVLQFCHGYDGPFLTIAGADDPATGYFEQYLALATGPKSSLVIPGTDHMLGVYSDQPEIAARVIAETTAWLGDNL